MAKVFFSRIGSAYKKTLRKITHGKAWNKITLREWRDKRFRERIDRVYFQKDSRGFRYIDGILITRDVVASTENFPFGDNASLDEATQHLVEALTKRDG